MAKKKKKHNNSKKNTNQQVIIQNNNTNQNVSKKDSYQKDDNKINISEDLDMYELSERDSVNNDEVVKDNGNKNYYNIISFLIAIFVVLGIIFFLSDSFDRQNQSYDRKVDITNIDKLAEEKYYSVSSNRELGTNSLIFFNDKNIDINTISSEDVLYVAYTLLNQEDRVTSGETLDECYINGKNDIENYPSKCYLETINKSLLDEQIRNYFSNNIKITYTDFKISSNQTCYYNNNTYKCYLNKSDSTIDNYRTISKYDSYDYVEDKLIVYSYLLTIRDSYDKDYEHGIYMDSKATRRIDTLDYFENELNKTVNQENIAKLINRYKDKASKYKTVFVKENNNFVWYSTEKVK